jgi:hypothetical protein
VNGSYTIGSLRASIQAIRTELNNALATTTNHKDVERLRDAIKDLDRALGGPWTPDGNHLACQHGGKVFNNTADAVNELTKMIRDPSTPGIPDATVQRWINTLVAIDRKLAQIAIAEAPGQGVRPGKIADAVEELARGDADAARGNYDKAIDHYQKAWKKVRDCDDDDDD